MLPRDFILRQTFMIFIPTTIKNQEATKLTKIYLQPRKSIAAGLQGRTREGVVNVGTGGLCYSLEENLSMKSGTMRLYADSKLTQSPLSYATFWRLPEYTELSFFWGSPEGDGVLENIRGDTGGICAPNALVASRKLLPVLIEVVGVKFPFVVLL